MGDESDSQTIDPVFARAQAAGVAAPAEPIASRFLLSIGSLGRIFGWVLFIAFLGSVALALFGWAPWRACGQLVLASQAATGLSLMVSRGGFFVGARASHRRRAGSSGSETSASRLAFVRFALRSWRFEIHAMAVLSWVLPLTAVLWALVVVAGSEGKFHDLLENVFESIADRAGGALARLLKTDFEETLAMARAGSDRAAWDLARRSIANLSPFDAFEIWRATRFSALWLFPSPNGEKPLTLPLAISRGLERCAESRATSAQEQRIKFTEERWAMLRAACESELLDIEIRPFAAPFANSAGSGSSSASAVAAAEPAARHGSPRRL
jgi:hypothetical protein